jgi:hypothetical protein
MGKPAIASLGDPGLLAKKMVSAAQIPHQELIDLQKGFALVPHVSEVEFYRINYPDLPIIDPRWNALQVCSLIGQASCIISSSLHGIVVADSFGIPAVWLERRAKPAGLHKFLDYFLSVGRSRLIRPRAFSGNVEKLMRYALPEARFFVDDIEASLTLALGEHVARRNSSGS